MSLSWKSKDIFSTVYIDSGLVSTTRLAMSKRTRGNHQHGERSTCSHNGTRNDETGLDEHQTGVNLRDVCASVNPRLEDGIPDIMEMKCISMWHTEKYIERSSMLKFFNSVHV